MTKELTTDEKIKKLNYLSKLAKEKENSKDIIEKIGIVTVYSSMVDFTLVQAARLVEQVLLKGKLAEGKEITLQPHGDLWFFEHQVRSRAILKEIKKLLPFKATKPEDEDKAKFVNNSVKDFITISDKFLTARNSIIHHILNPKKDMKKVESDLKKTITLFHKFMEIQKNFFEVAQPYRFSKKEMEFFYGKSKV
ncbi:MAG: hypothetical protein IIA82_08280 [Thaumarchaeota archaeon]|nr:hypothetical protein [Nitrososphaerota archaeon]